MGSLNTALMQHGYAILAVVVFLEAIGVPVPAAVALLIAGGAVARGVLQAQYVLGIALFAMLAGDTLMFLLGRYTGWWLLGLFRSIPRPAFCDRRIPSIAAAAPCWSLPSSFPGSTPWRRRLRAA
jgi:membrane protein DedA with SNARE-associated domain